MKNLTKVILKSGKDASVRRFHPWVFSGAIKKINGPVSDGDLVEICSNHDEPLGMGHYQDGSITVRIISFETCVADLEFWKTKIESAWNYRQSIGLTPNENTNVFRLVFAEGDGMPGLIIDFYNGTAVIQTHSIGMHLAKNQIIEALKLVLGDLLHAIYDKSAETLPAHYATEVTNGYLYGNPSETIVTENGCKFHIDWEKGQKTGFFIDQRENRQLLAKYAAGRNVLNMFCYTGGFSVYAMKAGANLVHSVDSSAKAIDITYQNTILNNFDPEIHKAFANDAIEYMNRMGNDYDLIILDPPAFAKHQNVRHNAVVGYKRLNALALEKIKKGGILFTFSCSQVVDRKLFESTIASAAMLAGRKIRIIHHLSQPGDHPVSIFHPEGEYLKGLVLQVE